MDARCLAVNVSALPEAHLLDEHSHSEGQQIAHSPVASYTAHRRCPSAQQLSLVSLTLAALLMAVGLEAVLQAGQVGAEPLRVLLHLLQICFAAGGLHIGELLSWLYRSAESRAPGRVRHACSRDLAPRWALAHGLRSRLLSGRRRAQIVPQPADPHLQLPQCALMPSSMALSTFC